MRNLNGRESIFALDKTCAGLIKQIRFESLIAYRFVRSDLWTTIYPGMAVSCSALSACSLINLTGFGRLFIAAIQSFVLFYGVAISEQWRSEEEDRLNKPWRPLAAGVLTLSQLKIRCFVTWSIILALTSLVGTVWWSLAVLSVSMLHAHMGLSRHWWAKSVLPPLAMLSMMGAQWQVIAPLNFEVCRWGIWMFAMTVMTIAVQDLRDVEGDRAVQRRTLPIVMGDKSSRILLAIIFASLPLLEFILMRITRNFSVQIGASFIFTSALSLFLAWRVRNRRGCAEDQLTYRFWEYWFTAMFVSMGLCITNPCAQG